MGLGSNPGTGNFFYTLRLEEPLPTACQLATHCKTLNPNRQIAKMPCDTIMQ